MATRYSFELIIVAETFVNLNTQAIASYMS